MQENETVKRSKHQPKSYRLDVPYFLAFEACANVYGTDKREVIFSLLDANKEIDAGKVKSLPEITQNILAEQMLEALKELNKPLKEATYLLNEPKIKKLVKYSQDVLGSHNEMPLKHLRILPDYQEFISSYSGSKRNGEPLELAIALFVNESNEYEFSLIETVFRSLVDKYASNSNDNKENKEEAKYKTYRFKTSFYLSFEILSSMYGSQKKREELIQRLPANTKNYLGKFPEYNQNEFAEFVLSALKKENKSKEELSYLLEDSRIVSLEKYMEKKKVKNDKERKSLKLEPDYNTFIKEFSRNVGDALEYAIALFIVNQDKGDYMILKDAFKNIIEEKAK